jgi:glucose-6-phosphate 1-epimerase
VNETHIPLSAEAPGVRITACPRGGHLMTWTTDGVERLWMSPLSGCGGDAAIRGGVPVLFPQFGTFGELPKHGFARTAEWTPVEPADVPGRATLAFELGDSEQTREVWPHPFRARLEVEASSTELRMGLIVHNLGHETARFTGGLHTYLAVADPDAWVEGLAGTHVWDGESTSEPHFAERLGARVPALAAQDLVVHGAVGPLVLHDAVLGDLHVAARGFPNRVVWNPGPGHGLPDVAPGDESGFVCIEPTAVIPISLPGGGTWEGRQHLYLG